MSQNSERKNIVVRLDAGNIFGFGHLSRCISLVESFASDHDIHFIIKTDDKLKVQNFIKSHYSKRVDSLTFIGTFLEKEKELELINQTVKSLNGFLIVDHYTADYEYQLCLRRNEIKWLQFDSHGDQKLCADLVLHGSPGATREIYAPLVDLERTKLLLGTQYAIVSKNFIEIRKKVRPRDELKKILVCFGGGNEKGATLKCLSLIDNNLFSSLVFLIIVSDRNPDLQAIQKISSVKQNIHIIVNSTEVHKLMADSDLAIIAPGTLSYEAASVGLPMSLITIADNQNINAKGWVHIGAAINLGNIEDINFEVLNSTLYHLIKHTENLKKMSINSMNSVDGLAPNRVRNEILSII